MNIVTKLGVYGACPLIWGTYRFFFGAVKECEEWFGLEDNDLLTYGNEWQEEMFFSPEGMI